VRLRQGKVGSKRKEHNMVVYLTFIIVECIRVSYNEGFVGQIRDFVTI